MKSFILISMLFLVINPKTKKLIGEGFVEEVEYKSTSTLLCIDKQTIIYFTDGGTTTLRGSQNVPSGYIQIYEGYTLANGCAPSRHIYEFVDDKKDSK